MSVNHWVWLTAVRENGTGKNREGGGRSCTTTSTSSSASSYFWSSSFSSTFLYSSCTTYPSTSSSSHTSEPLMWAPLWECRQALLRPDHWPTHPPFKEVLGSRVQNKVTQLWTVGGILFQRARVFTFFPHKTISHLFPPPPPLATPFSSSSLLTPSVSFFFCTLSLPAAPLPLLLPVYPRWVEPPPSRP